MIILILKSTIGINTYTLTPYNPPPPPPHMNKYIYINIQNYALKCTIKYITTAYISTFLNYYFFQKYKYKNGPTKYYAQRIR